jgi:hypothetical protein
LLLDGLPSRVMVMRPLLLDGLPSRVMVMRPLLLDGLPSRVIHNWPLSQKSLFATNTHTRVHKVRKFIRFIK